MSSDPVPTQSPFRLPRSRSPIALHRERMRLEQGGNIVEAVGRVELEMLPSLRFQFVMPSTSLAGPMPGEAQLILPRLGATVPVRVTHATLGGTGVLKGTILDTSVGSGAHLSEVRFLVANLPDFVGERLFEKWTDREGATVRSHWAGRVTLAADDWIIDLDERREYKELYDRLKAQGGFEVTHVGCLRRRDGAAFTGAEAGELLDALAGFLGFAGGAWATPLAAVGLDSAGQQVWQEFKPRWESPWRRGVRAPFDLRNHDLGKAFSGYLARWRNPVWNESLRIATQMYVEANGPITVDTASAHAQNILEVLAWTLFVLDLRTHQPWSFDRLRPSDRLRELVQWARVSPTIPRELPTLRQEAHARGWTDGPHAITDMRNAMIHPSGSRPRFTATPVPARIELQQLGLWYVERVILRLVGYRGSYSHRLRAKAHGDVAQLR